MSRFRRGYLANPGWIIPVAVAIAAVVAEAVGYLPPLTAAYR